MATLKSNNQLVTNITELDFNSIKEGIITYLKSQDRFKDYDFAGSNLNEFIDVLAYNTHYNAFYLNMVASEIFLSTAIKRESVVARARPLGYVPTSVRSATMVGNITLEYDTAAGPNPAQIVIPARTRFSADLLGVKYTFQTDMAYTAVPSSGNFYVANDVTFAEGRFFAYRKLIGTSDIDNGVSIPNLNVDTSKLTVKVFQSESSTVADVFTDAGKEIDIDSTDSVYFLSETDSLKYVIRFGDGIVGRAISPGNVVQIEYYIASGSVANGVSALSPLDPIANTKSVEVQVTSPASGGAEIETIESIKNNAPLAFQAQRRAVTAKDFVAVIVSNFSGIDTITAWGGQDNVPVALGNVFISIKPVARETLTDSEKFAIEKFLMDDYANVTVLPVLVDPDFLYIRMNTRIKYDLRKNTSATVIENDVRAAIRSIFSVEFKQFGNYFRYSRLVRAIDSANPAITNSLTRIEIEKRVRVSNTTVGDYLVRFFNPIKPGTFSSVLFSYTSFPAYLLDNGIGSVSVYRKVDGVDVPIVGGANIATIDYERGEVLFSSFVVDPVSSSTLETIRVFAEPSTEDVFGVRNLVISADDSTILLTSSVDDIPD